MQASLKAILPMTGNWKFGISKADKILAFIAFIELGDI